MRYSYSGGRRLKESEHNRPFYQLCAHIAPDYHQLEFDLRL